MKFYAVVFLFIAAGILISGIIVITQSIENAQQTSFLEKTATNLSQFDALKNEYLAKTAKTPYKVPVALVQKYPSNVDFCNAFCNNDCVIEKNTDTRYVNVYC